VRSNRSAEISVKTREFLCEWTTLSLLQTFFKTFSRPFHTEWPQQHDVHPQASWVASWS
jgi:hypothetical protein